MKISESLLLIGLGLVVGVGVRLNKSWVKLFPLSHSEPPQKILTTTYGQEGPGSTVTPAEINLNNLGLDTLIEYLQTGDPSILSESRWRELFWRAAASCPNELAAFISRINDTKKVPLEALYTDYIQGDFKPKLSSNDINTIFAACGSPEEFKFACDWLNYVNTDYRFSKGDHTFWQKLQNGSIEEGNQISKFLINSPKAAVGSEHFGTLGPALKDEIFQSLTNIDPLFAVNYVSNASSESIASIGRSLVNSSLSSQDPDALIAAAHNWLKIVKGRKLPEGEVESVTEGIYNMILNNFSDPEAADQWRVISVEQTGK
jgi:hypothetical protein